MGYVSVPWRVRPGRLTWNLQITHFSVFLRVGNSSETASISIFFATFRFKTPPFKAAALRAAKGGWGWGVLILWEKKPGSLQSTVQNGATGDSVALDTSEGRPWPGAGGK